MAEQHGPLQLQSGSNDRRHNQLRSYAADAGMEPLWYAHNIGRWTQKPGAEGRPGSILQFQFPE
jgi:hypothetical protein